ncbi:hypothetical protein [Bacillus massiliglaciei]|uniref:hypothetical protein n=1 Tax=Bacillus massiliglaciei TaxID=1816693 RepID=UPI000DA5FC93|nr:hypothetical protein [Bacillus massiliglaciei]
MNMLSPYLPQDDQEFSRLNLKSGLWIDEGFDWYPEDDLMSRYPHGEIRTFLQTQKKDRLLISKLTIKNNSFKVKHPKFFFRYENAFEKKAVAFYSPPEQAILHIGSNSVVLLGGAFKGKGISQYCIQGKGGLYQNGCFKSLKEGILSYSPLAKGEVTSIFTLESRLEPGECVEASAWAIQADSKEEAQRVNDQLFLAQQK